MAPNQFLDMQAFALREEEATKKHLPQDKDPFAEVAVLLQLFLSEAGGEEIKFHNKATAEEDGIYIQGKINAQELHVIERTPSHKLEYRLLFLEKTLTVNNQIPDHALGMLVAQKVDRLVTLIGLGHIVFFNPSETQGAPA